MADLQERLDQWLAECGEEGASIDDVRAAFADASDNALRYRLRKLREQGAIRVEGATRGARYVSTHPVMDRPSCESEHEHAIFSPESAEIMASLKRPIHERAVASYDAAWVMANLGGEGLLSETQRVRLHELGRTGEESAPAGTYARRVCERLLVDLSWASSALEGNTYTLLDTKRLIEQGVAATGHDAREAQMILNHKRGIEFLLDALSIGLVRMVISNLHAVLMENLIEEPAALGAIRRRPVGISGSTYAPPSSPQRLAEGLEFVLAATRRVADPFERSLRLLVHLPYLQPFLDGNKRTARLLANLPLFEENLKPLSFVDVPREEYLYAVLCVYERRDVRPMVDLFVWAYTRSCQRYPDVTARLADPDPFRMAHRDRIYEAVHAVVTALDAQPEARVEAIARGHFEGAGDQLRFVAMVLADLSMLHEGNFMRYRIRPSELDTWLSMKS